MTAFASSFFLLIFKVFFSVGAWVVIFALPGFVALIINYGVLGYPIRAAYKHWYSFAVLYDRVLPYRIRAYVELFVILAPALFVAVISIMGYGGLVYKKVWAKDPEPTQVLINEEIRTYELIGFLPPLNYYVALRDVKSGAVYNNLLVATHCAKYSQWKIGDKFNFQVANYSTNGQPTVLFKDLATMCT